MDGTVDYTSFTDDELQQAHSSINRARYPRNAAHLDTELARRGPGGQSVAETYLGGGHSRGIDDLVDFSSFTDQELDESLQVINRDKYPVNFAKLKAVRAARGLPAEIEQPVSTDPAAEEARRQHALLLRTLRQPRLLIGMLLTVIIGVVLLVLARIT